VKFAPKRSAPKWTSNKMGTAKKGHNKTSRSKVVASKRRASKSMAVSLHSCTAVDSGVAHPPPLEITLNHQALTFYEWALHFPSRRQFPPTTASLLSSTAQIKEETLLDIFQLLHQRLAALFCSILLNPRILSLIIYLQAATSTLWLHPCSPHKPQISLFCLL